MADPWAIAEAVATSVAAGAAAYQIRLSRRDANARAVFDHLREIDRRVQDAWLLGAAAAQTELLDYYRKKRPDLTEGARAYLALLNSLDVLAYAADRKLLDGQVAADYLKTLLTPDVISLTFISQFQECCGDTSVYEHLEAFLTKYRWLRKPTISGS